MKKTPPADQDDLLPEYQFDYKKAKPNRFAASSSARTVVLDEDVAQVFTISESVNRALRALIEVVQSAKERKTA